MPLEIAEISSNLKSQPPEPPTKEGHCIVLLIKPTNRGIVLLPNFTEFLVNVFGISILS
jgi:hypothetical protein